MRLISALVFIFLFASWISAQSEARTKVKFIGRNIVFPVITYQRDCPLKIEKFLVVENNKGRYETEYAVRNIGRKSIKAYRVARWFSDDTGFLGYGALPPGDKLIRPGSVVDTTRGVQIVSDSNASRSPDALMKIVFTMVVDIEFADGSEYSDERSFDALETHLKRFADLYQ